MKRFTDKERLDWLLNNRDLGVRDPGGGYGQTLWIERRSEIDAAILRERRGGTQ